MLNSTKVFLAALATVWTTSAASAPLTDMYSSLVVFGDSLSDTGNLAAATSGAIPPDPPYAAGRFSNGPIWADLVGKDFTDLGRLSLNFAFGGAKAVTDADPVPDLLAQVELFRGFAESAASVALGPRPLGVVFFGGNDLFAAAKLADGEQKARDAANAVRAQVDVLASLGLRDIVLVNSIDISLTPRVAVEGDSDPLAARLATTAFNDALMRPIIADPVSFNDVTLFDFAEVSAATIADPAGSGFTNVTDACLSTLACIGLGAQDDFLFYDAVHPNSVAHALVADAFRSGATTKSLVLAPVPLPAAAWSLLGGLALLGAMGARRNRHPTTA